MREPAAQTTSGDQVLSLLDGVLLVETANGELGVIDAHAAFKAHFTQSFRDALAETPSATPPVSQPLLVPVSRAMPDVEPAAVLAMLTDVGRLGLVLRETGPQTVALMQVPSPLRNADTDDVMNSVLAFLQHADATRLCHDLAQSAATASTDRAPNAVAAALEGLFDDPYATRHAKTIGAAELRRWLAERAPR